MKTQFFRAIALALIPALIVPASPAIGWDGQVLAASGAIEADIFSAEAFQTRDCLSPHGPTEFTGLITARFFGFLGPLNKLRTQFMTGIMITVVAASLSLFAQENSVERPTPRDAATAMWGYAAPQDMQLLKAHLSASLPLFQEALTPPQPLSAKDRASFLITRPEPIDVRTLLEILIAAAPKSPSQILATDVGLALLSPGGRWALEELTMDASSPEEVHRAADFMIGLIRESESKIKTAGKILQEENPLQKKLEACAAIQQVLLSRHGYLYSLDVLTNVLTRPDTAVRLRLKIIEAFPYYAVYALIVEPRDPYVSVNLLDSLIVLSYSDKDADVRRQAAEAAKLVLRLYRLSVPPPSSPWMILLIRERSQTLAELEKSLADATHKKNKSATRALTLQSDLLADALRYYDSVGKPWQPISGPVNPLAVHPIPAPFHVPIWIPLWVIEAGFGLLVLGNALVHFHLFLYNAAPRDPANILPENRTAA